MPPELEDGSQIPSDNADSPSPQVPDLGNMVNAAVSAHIKRFTEKQLPAILESALKPITEKLAAAPKDDEESSGSKKSKPDPQIAALQRQLEDMKLANAKAEEARVAAERKSRDDRTFADLRSELAKTVRPEFVDMLAHHLFTVKRVVDFQDDGTPVVKMTRPSKFGLEPEEQHYGLQAGIAEFLKSDDAKPFLPAPTTNSSGNVRPQRAPIQNHGGPIDPSKMTEEQRLAHVLSVQSGNS